MKRHFKNLLLGLIVVAMIFGSGFDSLATVLNEPENPGNIEVNKSAEATEECREFEVTLEITGTPPAKPVDVVLVIDTSGSMSTDGRIGAAKTAAKSFADVVLGDGNPNNNRISVVNYSTRANHTKDWTNDLSAVKSSINNLSTSGYTNIHEGFIFAENRIDAAITARPESTKVIVMMSDGGANRWMDGSTVKYTTNYPTSHNNSTNAAWQKGQALQSKANIFTIGLFTGMPSNQYLIAKDTLVKSAPSGQFYDSPTTAELEGIYTSIAGLINYSAKDAEVIDIIGNNFELVPNSFVKVPASATVSVDGTGRIITWKPGTVGTSATLTYKIKAKDDFAGGNNVDTNESAELKYTNINGDKNQSKIFPKPKVDVLGKKGSLQVVKELYEADGETRIQDNDTVFSFLIEGPNNYSKTVTATASEASEILEDLVAGEYTITETLIDGYEATEESQTINLEIDHCGDNELIKVIFKNKLSETIDIIVDKVWKGGEEQRPNITINLLADGEKVDSKELSSGTTSHKFSGKPKYNSSGQEIQYTITEDSVDGYSSSIDGFTVINTRSEKIDIPVTKIWKGSEEERPDITINLLANGKKVDSVTLSNGTTTHTFSGHAKYDEDGELIKYTISEDPVAGYSSSIDRFNVTNTRSAEFNIPIVKIWKGSEEERPDITINLLANGKKVDSVTLSNGTTTHTFVGQPKYDKDGKPIKYTLTEGNVAGYRSSIDGFKVTNIRSSKFEIPVEKVWIGDQEERPDITINLLANGKQVDSVTLSNGTTTHTFTDLPEYDEDGKLIEYTITENELEGYVSSVDGFKVINSLKDWEGDIEIIKDVKLGESELVKIKLAAKALNNLFANGALSEFPELAEDVDNEDIEEAEALVDSIVNDGIREYAKSLLKLAKELIDKTEVEADSFMKTLETDDQEEAKDKEAEKEEIEEEVKEEELDEEQDELEEESKEEDKAVGDEEDSNLEENKDKTEEENSNLEENDDGLEQFEIQLLNYISNDKPSISKDLAIQNADEEIIEDKEILEDEVAIEEVEDKEAVEDKDEVAVEEEVANSEETEEDKELVEEQDEEILTPEAFMSFELAESRELELDDLIDKLSLKGFEFELFMEGEEVALAEGTTDEDGRLLFRGIKAGRYFIREKEKEGYVSSIPDGYEFDFDEELGAIKVTNTIGEDPDPDPEPKPDPKPDRDPRPKRDPKPKPEPEPEEEPEIIIVPEPTPEVPPVIVEPEPVEPVVEVVEEIVEEVPQATLPKTGTADPMLFSGLGAALLGLGLFLKKKREDE